MTSAPFPDQAAIRRFVAEGRRPLAVTANPMAEALGMRILALDEAAGSIDLGFSPAALFVQGTGVLQGGAVTAMLDFAMAFAVMAALPDGVVCSTVSLNAHLMRAAPIDDYRAVGRVEMCGAEAAFASGRLLSAKSPDITLATGTSVLVLRRRAGFGTSRAR